MAETQVTHSQEPAPEPLASSQETTAIASKVGEHEVKLEQASQTAQEAQSQAQSAAAAAEAALTAPHSHDDYATKSDLAGLGDRLAGVLESRLPKAPEQATPPAVQTPPPDDAPKSREKKAEKKSIADRFYGR